MSIYKEWTLPEMRQELNRIACDFWNLQQDLYALSLAITEKEFEARRNKNIKFKKNKHQQNK